MRRVVLFLFALLEFALLGATAAVHYFGHAKMGMARTLVFVNSQIRSVLPTATLRAAALFLACALAAMLATLFVRSGRRSISARFLVVWQVVLAAALVSFATFIDPTRDRAYLVVLIGLTLLALINVLAALVVLYGTPAARQVRASHLRKEA